MKSFALCPISDKRINERVARLNAVFTVLLLVSFALNQNPIILLFLLVDFLLRSLELSRYSPLALLSNTLVKRLSLKPLLINAGPKIFAARIGLFFSISILISFLLGFQIISISLLVVFAICALLEAVIGFCLACEIYPFVYKVFYR